MKRNPLIVAAILLAPLAFHSCLDYQDPGSELTVTQSITDDQLYSGDVNKIDYKKEISEEDFKKSLANIESKLGLSKTGQYCLRGAKNGDVPKAHSYQFQYSLGPDAYAQYMIVPHRDFPYSNTVLTSTYNISEKFNGGPRGSYTMVKNALMPLLNHPDIDNMPEIKAVNLLYYCVAAQEMADLSGPFSYTEDKKNLEQITTYDDLKTIYYGIVDNLDTIVKCLKHFQTRPEWYQKGIKDILTSYHETSRAMFNGEPGVDTYIALANSLKLRMAMHIVKVEPQTAQKWAEEAVKEGVIENVDQQQGLFPLLSGFAHPLVEIMSSWNDLRMGASFESLLMSLDHPTTKYLWKNNHKAIGDLPADSKIVGIRTGDFVGTGQSDANNPFECYSKFSVEAMANAPLYFVKYAEVCFLRAEGALRGWAMGGTAEHFYNEGIRYAYYEDPQEAPTSQYTKLVEEYMKKEQATPYVQVDPQSKTEWPSTTKIGVKWNEADEREVKLEKIITQKYIALFPLSNEAWTEMRRTGYPKLFPVLNTDEGDGTIEPGDMIRRIPWLATDPQFQSIIENTGIPALGGDDYQATRLWWDTTAPNF